MTIRALGLALPLALLLPLAATAELREGPATPDPVLAREVAQSFIFTMASNAPAQSVRETAERAVSAAGGRLGPVYVNAFKGFAAEMSPEAARALLAQNRNVFSFEPDGIVTTLQAANTIPVQDNWDITRVGGERGDFSATASVGWVIDTGIARHVELNIIETLSAGFTSEGRWTDGNGHGTHVAGTMAARDDGAGVIGVAPGARVVAVKVLRDSGSGAYSDVIAGIDYVAGLRQTCATLEGIGCDPRAWVVNMSLGGSPSNALDSAVINAAAMGVRFSIAAGNSSLKASRFSPARVEHTNVLTIAATDRSDKFARYSNHGIPPVDFAAPGSAITSTWIDGDAVSDGINTISGTSMAAPHVAGLLMLNATLNATTTADFYCRTVVKNRQTYRIAFNGPPSGADCQGLSW